MKSVYIIGAEGMGRYKIGVAVDVEWRLQSLQASSPVPLYVVYHAPCPDAYMAEAQLHQQFYRHRRHGEWFDLHPWEVGVVKKRLNSLAKAGGLDKPK